MAEQLSEDSVATGTVTDDLVVVSNREPYRHEFDPEGGPRDVVVDRPTGGLTAGLDPVMQRLGGTWIAWGDGEADFIVGDEDNSVGVPPEDPSYTLRRIPLSTAEVSQYYEGYANRTLWPLCHSAVGNLHVDTDEWEEYRSVNRKFADATAAAVDDDSVVWFQDYHFALAPRLLREQTDAMIMQFWHIPWPSADVFRLAPHAAELLDGLLANDLLGFHVPRYCTYFLDCVEESLEGAVVDRDEGTVRYRDRTTRVASFPLGVDADAIAQGAADAPDGSDAFRRDHGIDPDQPLVIGVDRLDYTKGIPERLEALEHLWETRPHLRGAFTFVQKSQESREGIREYQELQTEVDGAVRRINDRFGTDEWQPVVSTTEHLPSEQLYGLYRDAEAVLITPVRDGMNLVAKEFVAAQAAADTPGVLVLSELTGAADEFDDGPLLVNPYDTEGCADAIEQALAMGDEERTDRMRRLREHVAERDVTAWIDSMFDSAADVQLERQGWTV